jgi:uncharacterized protein (TIGR02677 family)
MYTPRVRDGNWIHPSLLKKVPEAAYLNAENAARYRPILRYFYLQHTAHRYWLSFDEIFENVRPAAGADYTPEFCEQDLAQLTAWGNVMAEQEKSRARTIDEFQRRRLQYQLTPYSIALERLLCELETSGTAKGSLDPTLLDRLWSRLEGLARDMSDLRRTRRDWTEAYEYFQQIVNDANDFLSAMHRSRPQDLNQIEAFLAFKEVLVQYLSAFINQLMDVAEKIRALFESWPTEKLIDLLVVHDSTLMPSPDGRMPEAPAVRSAYSAQMRAIQEWFRRGGGVEILRRVTADAIEMTVRHAQRLVDRRTFGVSRRRELLELAKRFADCRTVEEAHALAASTLGCALPRHLLCRDQPFVVSDESVWAQAPEELPLTRIHRSTRSRSVGAPIEDRSREQQEVLRAELEARRREAALWDELFADGEIDLTGFDVPEPAVRGRLLHILGRCAASPDGSALVPDGSRIELLAPLHDGPGRIDSPDGTLHLPAYRLRREGAAE